MSRTARSASARPEWTCQPSGSPRATRPRRFRPAGRHAARQHWMTEGRLRPSGQPSPDMPSQLPAARQPSPNMPSQRPAARQPSPDMPSHRMAARQPSPDMPSQRTPASRACDPGAPSIKDAKVASAGFAFRPASLAAAARQEVATPDSYPTDARGSRKDRAPFDNRSR